MSCAPPPAIAHPALFDPALILAAASTSGMANAATVRECQDGAGQAVETKFQCPTLKESIINILWFYNKLTERIKKCIDVITKT